MADREIVPLDTSDDHIRYELGRANWAPASEDGHGWVPAFVNGGTGTVRLNEDQVIDVVILGDGYDTQAQFLAQLEDWLADFFRVDVYGRFRGAFRIRAVFHRSPGPCTSSARDSYYACKIDEEGDVAGGGWWNADDAEGRTFRQRFWDAIEAFAVNTNAYPGDLDVQGSRTVIHNQLANLYSNLVAVMLVRRSKPDGKGGVSIVNNAGGLTRTVHSRDGHRNVNVSFGANALHEFGHGFAYLEDEYISSRGSRANRSNPRSQSLFTLSNLSFTSELASVPWVHLSPWGTFPRQAAGSTPSPVVGWLWRGGEADEGVWHSEYQCLMNGTHENYAYTSNAALDPSSSPVDGCIRFKDGGTILRWRDPPRYCLWCQEIVVLRILEKTGQLAQAGDVTSINRRGEVWYARWLDGGRQRYFDYFGVASQIRERERLYQTPTLELGSLCQLRKADGSYLALERSDLYQVFDADPVKYEAPFEPDDAEELLMILA